MAAPSALTHESWQDASRISHADELQLACRLAECRRELLALALNTRRCINELRRIRTEIGSGKLHIKDVMELERRTPEEARAAFEAWVESAAELQRNAARAWRESAAGTERNDASASSEGSGAGIPARLRHAAVDEQIAQSLALVRSLNLSAPILTRLIRSLGEPSGTLPAASGRPAARSLPPELQRSVRRLELETGRIRDRFLSANQGLVSYVVQRYLGMGLSHADLMQEGNIGLMRAIEKFDHRRGGRFGTYAVWWVRQGVRRALANQSRTIRIPVHALGARYSLDQTARRLALQLGRDPTEDELSKATGVVQSNVHQLLGLAKEPLSLDAPRGTDTDVRLGDSLADSTTKTGMDRALDSQRSEHLKHLLGSLSPREQDMLRMRFGLDGSDECTLEQIGHTFSVTRERVRQIVTSALQKLNRQTRLLQLELTGS